MDYIRRFLRQDQDYFSNNQADIQQQNYSVLRIACLIYLLVLLIYTAITIISGQSKTLITMYLVYDAIHIVLCAVVFSRAVKKSGRYRNICRILFEVTLLSFFILEAAIPFPHQQSIYYPFPIILLAMVFINKPQRVLALILSYVAIFVVMVCLFKSPGIKTNDIYIASGTMISSLAGYVIVSKLRHETSEAMERLRYLSTTDTMTGLYNKQTFESLCRAYMENESKIKGFALLFFDVDKFKQINDKHGHPFGDLALKSIAAVMREVFYDKDYLCRYGGDEFVIFMVDIESERDIHEKLRLFNSRIASLGKKLQLESLSCSVGIAMMADRAESYSKLLSRADTALYLAKESAGK